MISFLVSPTVCVIDDEQEEYAVILKALNRLHLPAVHISGTSIDELPPQPFRGMRLVFQDLHLGGETGKTAASKAANYFTRIVPSNSAPVIGVAQAVLADHRVEFVASHLPFLRAGV